MLRKDLFKLTLVLSSAIFLASCETAPEPEPVIVVEPEPEPVVYVPPPREPLRIAERPVEVRMTEPLIREAAAYGAFMQTVNRSYSPMQSAGDLNANLDGLAVAYSPRFGAGMLSYGALVAAQNSQFVDSVMARADAEGVDAVTYKLFQSPSYVQSFSGASAAAQDVAASWWADRATINGAAASVKQQSYDLQKDPEWKKQRADNRKERIDAFKAAQNYRPQMAQSQIRDIAAAGSISSSDWDGDARRAAFWQAYGRGSKPASQTANTAFSPRMRRALTLGALEILGATDQQNATFVANYTNTPRLAQCMNWARLHAEQCLAAGHYKFEDAFCIAEHELGDLNDCLVKNGF